MLRSVSIRGIALLVVFLASGGWAGDIQILSEAGLRVYLDDQLVGVTNDRQDGLYLLDIPSGSHTLRLEHEGYYPQRFEVEVTHLPIEVRVEEEWVPLPVEHSAPAEPSAEPTAREGTPLQVGQLVVTSAPQRCTVTVDGRTEDKTTPHLSLGGLTAGPHEIAFSREGYATISDTIEIPAGAEITVRGNLIDGKVEVVYSGKGSLRLTSTPSRCTVRFLGSSHEKTRGRLNLSFIPSGWHELAVSIPGRTLTTEVLILDGQRTLVEVSFIEGDEPFTISHVQR